MILFVVFWFIIGAGLAVFFWSVNVEISPDGLDFLLLFFMLFFGPVVFVAFIFFAIRLKDNG